MKQNRLGSYRLWVAALILVTTVPMAGADDVPGWIKAGSRPTDYNMGIDPSVPLAGKPSGFIKSIVAETQGFGTYMQMFDAGDYRGKRVQFSAQVKCENVLDWAGLWMRVDGENKSGIAFDNMQNRPIKGTQNWTKYSVVLDVDSKASAVAFGILLSGKGSVWINDVKFETVGDNVLVTDLKKQPSPPLPPRPTGPRNLGFDPK